MVQNIHNTTSQAPKNEVSKMFLAIALTIALVAVYCKFKLTEEVESLSASIVVCLCLLLSLVFTPLLVKFLLLILLLIYQKAIPTKSIDLEKPIAPTGE